MISPRLLILRATVNSQPEPAGITVFRSMPGLVAFGHIKACVSEKSLLNVVPNHLPFIANTLRRPVDELASGTQNDCGTDAGSPEHGAGFGEVCVVGVPSHVACVVQPWGDRPPRAKRNTRINEFSTREASATGVLVLLAQNAA